MIDIRIGDMRVSLDEMEPNSIDSCVTDPPYHLASIVKRFGAEGAAPAKSKQSGVYERSSRGFMGQTWDGGDVAFRPETWAKVLRVLKPGAHLLAFAASKNAHRLFCAVEDAGFEIRDTIMWLYGSGFPKSHNLEGEWGGWGTALKPAYEPIVVARKPLIGTVAANVMAHGVGALNVDGCRVGTDENRSRDNSKCAPDSFFGGKARINQVIDNAGRWPANVIHDGSDEVLAGFPHTKSGLPGIMRKGVNDGAAYGKESRAPGTPMTGFGDEGSAARFFHNLHGFAFDGSRYIPRCWIDGRCGTGQNDLVGIAQVSNQIPHLVFGHRIELAFGHHGNVRQTTFLDFRLRHNDFVIDGLNCQCAVCFLSEQTAD